MRREFQFPTDERFHFKLTPMSNAVPLLRIIVSLAMLEQKQGMENRKFLDSLKYPIFCYLPQVQINQLTYLS
jgi:hypothetical protein